MEIPEILFHPDAMERISPKPVPQVVHAITSLEEEEKGAEEKTEEGEIIIADAETEGEILFKGIDPAKEEEIPTPTEEKIPEDAKTAPKEKKKRK